jgi:hypothetical protein
VVSAQPRLPDVHTWTLPTRSSGLGAVRERSS